MIERAVELLELAENNAVPGDWRPAQCTPARPGTWAVGVGRIGDGVTSDAPLEFVTPWGMGKDEAILISLLHNMLPQVIDIMKNEAVAVKAGRKVANEEISQLASAVVRNLS